MPFVNYTTYKNYFRPNDKIYYDKIENYLKVKKNESTAISQ